MATVFMKWLENSPEDYDRGIEILTLGRLKQVKERIVQQYIHADSRVLEIGCGTGTLTVLMAEQGASVSAIDASPIMLVEASNKITAHNLETHVSLEQMDVTQIGDHFSHGSFDLIVATLVFSELPSDVQRYSLETCAKLLAPGGRLVIADEIVPRSPIAHLLFYLVRGPLTLLTWLLTRTSTAALHDFDQLLEQTGFHVRSAASYLGGSLVVYEASITAELSDRPPKESAGIATGCLPRAIQSAPPRDTVVRELPPGVVGRLQHSVTLRTLLIDLWALFFRIIPPYPKVRPGLYAVGNPDSDSPVLVTGNFDLTVRRLVQAIDGQVDVWLLVADSAGINVWCAAGGGYFTAEKVIASVKSSHLSTVVKHHALILPQLCANGIDGWCIRQETGWGVHWGPVRAEDIPSYLAAKRKKTDPMRWVRFPLKDRLEMVTVTLGFYGLLILIPVFIFLHALFWSIAISLIGLSYFYAVVHPWLPGNDGRMKSFPLAVIALSGLLVYALLGSPMTTLSLFHWTLGLIGLSIFTAGELQGMSPLMRGEQANWGWELSFGVFLGLIYWLTPLVLGWV